MCYYEEKSTHQDLVISRHEGKRMRKRNCLRKLMSAIGTKKEASTSLVVQFMQQLKEGATGHVNRNHIVKGLKTNCSYERTEAACQEELLGS